MKYNRIDHSEHLIHFTKDSSTWDYQKSYDVFCKIIEDGFLKSSKALRLGNIESICFTEATYPSLTQNCELNKKYFEKYSPFGFLFTKKHVYSKGGLPVIYSPKKDFEKDNEKTNWRTVSYNPLGGKDPYSDYTWEREWRIKPEDKTLILDPNEVKLVFPSQEWALKFRDDHDKKHLDESCECNCTRKCTIINYDRFESKEEYDILIGTCPDPLEFPWILLNMNCKSIIKP